MSVLLHAACSSQRIFLVTNYIFSVEDCPIYIGTGYIERNMSFFLRNWRGRAPYRDLLITVEFRV
jgi:hypothetical protein